MKAFAVEPLGDLSGRGPGSPQLDHAIAQGLIIAELLIFLNGTTNLVPALQAASPADRHVDPLGLSADAHGDPFHQEPDDRLPVLDRGAGGVPQPRQVTGPRFDPLAVGGGRLSRRVGLEPVILFLQTALFPQGLLPAPLQLAGHQAVLGLDGVVLASRALGLDPRPFQPLLPVLVQPLAFALQIGNGLKTQFQLGRLEDLQHLLGDQRLERAAGENSGRTVRRIRQIESCTDNKQGFLWRGRRPASSARTGRNTPARSRATGRPGERRPPWAGSDWRPGAPGWPGSAPR